MTDFQAVARQLVFRYLVSPESHLTEADLNVVQVVKVGQAAEVTLTVSGFDVLYQVRFDSSGVQAKLYRYVMMDEIDINDPFTRPYKARERFV